MSWTGTGKPGERDVFVGIFGKHPGWDDHIDDIGLDTDRLVAVKRVLYSEGIGGNIDSGAWEKLDEAQRLSSFGHELVWRLDGDLIVGRIWASRDGKGRTRYPMGVVAQCTGVPAPVVEAEVMPRLEEAERRFIAASSAAEVRQIVEEVRGQLRGALGAAPAADSYGEVAPPAELASMADLPQLGEGRVGLYRVLYEIERELGAFRPATKSDSRKTTKFVDVRAQHLRVPACASSTFAAARLWFGVLATQIDPTASMLALRPLGKGFIDLVIGQPGAQQLFCVKASEKGLAPASDVPYTLDAEFIKNCTALVESWRAGLASPGESGGAPGQADAAAQPPDAEPVLVPAQKKSGWFKWIGIGGVVLIAGGVTYYAVTRPASTGPGPAGVPVAVNTKPAAEPKPGVKSLLDTPASKTEPPASSGDGKAAKRPEAEPRPAATGNEQKKVADAKALRDREAEEEQKKRAADEAEKKRQADAAAQRQREEDEKRLAAEEAKRQAADAEAKKTELVRAATELAGLLASGYGLDEEAAGGSVRTRAAALTGDPLFASLRESSPEAKAVGERVAALEKIAGSTDPALLSGQAAGAPVAEALAAWSRLASGAAQGWPATVSDLEAAAKAVAALRKAATTVPDQARAGQLALRVNADAKRVWLGYLARVSPADPAGISAAGARMDAFGVVLEDLPPRARFNILLSNLARDAAAWGQIKPGDSDALARASQRVGLFAKDVSALGLGAAAGPALDAANALVKALGARPAFDPSKAGPGLRGWKGEVREAGPVISVIYSPTGGSGAPPIEFIRVEAPTGPAFVGSSEVTLGLVIETAERQGKWPDLLTLLPQYQSDVDSRLGARVWDWTPGGKSIVPSPVSDGYLLGGWLPATPQMRGVQYYADGVPPAPSVASPMQSITAAGAIYVARLLACRLPTVGEWKAAVAVPGTAAPQPNRRDATWARTQAYLVNETKTKVPPPRVTWPDEGVFRPPTARPPIRTSAEPAVESDDGLMWFAEQGAGPGGVFSHLIGNVAEFVLEQPPAVDLGSIPTTDEARREIGPRGEEVKVIGASALSAKEIDPQTPCTLDPLGADRAYFSDVGFRLAFPASGVSPAVVPDVAGAVKAIRHLSLSE